MTILERLERDMVDAAKARDSARLGSIRFARSEITNRRIELGRDMRDDDVIEVLARIAKRHRESIEQFQGAGRDDLVSRESAQLKVIEEYLPERLGDDELAAIVEDAIAEVALALSAFDLEWLLAPLGKEGSQRLLDALFVLGGVAERP